MSWNGTRRRWIGARSAGLPPSLVAGFSAGLVLLTVVALTLLHHDLSQATRALLLVVPVIIAAVLGSRWVAYLIAAVATIAFTLSVPPIGSISFAAVDDAIALAVFFAVAVVVSTLVANRIDSLAETDAQRRLLLRSVSHDLRTPLATVRAATTELLDGVDHEPRVRERLLRLVDLESERLDRLVTNLLDLNRIEAGAMSPRRRPTDLDQVIRRSVARFDLLPADVRLECESDADLPTLSIDPTQIEQVLANLLDNAVRHSLDGGVVNLSAERDGDGVRIEVADRGPGVPPDETDLVFEPFRSGAIAGSSGIGLAVSRAIVELHDGTIFVDDRPGGGARFVVTLPGD